MSAEVNALLGALGAKDASREGPFWLGTITGVTSASLITVALDGAETAVSVTKGPSGAVVGDRVIVTRIGRALYLIVNLTRV